MERLNSSESGFWTTIDLLIERKWRETEGNEDFDIRNKRQFLLGKKFKKIVQSRKKPSIFSDPDSPLCKNDFEDEFRHWLEQSDRMQRLHDQLRHLAEEDLQKRIAARQSNEMDRLKRLILSGKTPLKDCPPELREQPVFVFWRVIDKEVQKLSKAKADAYYRKLRRPHRKSSLRDPSTNPESEESSISAEDYLGINQISDNNNEQTNRGSAMDTQRFTPQETTTFKYEDEDVKELRELTTVAELYRMADQIIGVPRETDVAK